MSAELRPLALCCLLAFHAPDGSQLLLESAAISAIRPIAPSHRPQVTQGVRSVVYIGAQGFGVMENAGEVMTLIDGCGRK